jgi:hypothetical protein
MLPFETVIRALKSSNYLEQMGRLFPPQSSHLRRLWYYQYAQYELSRP